MSQKEIYLCIARTETGEKLAEYVAARVPDIGEIITLSYLDAQGKFLVLDVVHRSSLEDYKIVTLKVKPVDPIDKPSGGSISLGRQVLRMMFKVG